MPSTAKKQPHKTPRLTIPGTKSSLYISLALQTTHIDPNYEDDQFSNYSNFSLANSSAHLSDVELLPPKMSTRRTTRATSKAASSRDASPSVTEYDIPATPSRRPSRIRASATPLPPIASNSSVAYGTNTVAAAGALNASEVGEPAGDMINNILKRQRPGLPAVDEEEENTSGSIRPLKPAAASTVSKSNRNRFAQAPKIINNSGISGRSYVSSNFPDDSFAQGSAIFGGAGLDDSSVIEAADASSTPKALRPTREDAEREKVTKQLRNISQTPVHIQEHPVTAEPDEPSLAERSFQWLHRKGDQALDIFGELAQLLHRSWAWLKTPAGWMAAGILASILLSVLIVLPGFGFRSSSTPSFDGTGTASNRYQYYGLADPVHNIGQFIPEFFAHPLRTIQNDADAELVRRLKKVEYELAYLQKRTDIDAASISYLQSILPEQIVVKRNEKGKLEIPNEFWLALDSKMRNESANLRAPSHSQDTGGSSSSDISHLQFQQIEAHMEDTNMWERYFLKYRPLLDSRTHDIVNLHFPQKFKEFSESSAVVSRREFVDMFHSYWAESKKEIKAEIKKLSKGLEPTELLQSQIEDISLEVFKKQIYQTQLHGAAKAFLNIDLAQTFKRVNHFSTGTGAVINPKLTSPNYVPPNMDRSIFVRGLAAVVYRVLPRPNPPEMALQRWDEFGECWCSPAVDNDGLGPSLGVIMSNYIVPDHIVVEHVPRTASLEPNSAPKEMELFAMIEDETAYHHVKYHSEDTFHERTPEGEKTPFGFVRIAKWVFDAKSVDNLQAFAPQVNLGDVMFKGLAYTNRLIVRSKSNWSGMDGAPNVNHTCLYRVRLTGEVIKPGLPPANLAAEAIEDDMVVN